MSTSPSSFSALVVRQWLTDWEDVNFNGESHQAKPNENFLVTSMPASVLRRLSNTYRREAAAGARSSDTGIQRKHDPVRSDEISRYVREGYPLSTLSAAKRRVADANLRKPGWLPTAVVVNILDPQQPRAGRAVAARDALQVPDTDSWSRGGIVELALPKSWSDDGWEPADAHPIEIIDGQHRLWSFDGDDSDADFDLPVVAFFGLDISWQAYLFWTINIKPKKINASLAYDLYPLLRDQDWLLAGEGIDVYRETRSQELTEALWAHPDSPWYARINMLGETGVRESQPVTQAAFVRSIADTFVRPWKSRTSRIGGLFGGASNGRGADWSRAQQAAFLIAAWRELQKSIAVTESDWTRAVRGDGDTIDGVDRSTDPAFAGPHTLLSSDQGMRAYHQALNDLVYVAAVDLDLASWRSVLPSEDVSLEAISFELDSFSKTVIYPLIAAIAGAMANFDWRNAKAEGLSRDELIAKQALRGTGGYKLLRERLLDHVGAGLDANLAKLATDAASARS
ncbi:DGQHR domain-containing protein [Microbacterium paraoxydans]|uniref:DGQHR domain-containing protein n=1 Tax=Microbacterium paraoxydans TaxID=199592 RepID=UPI002F2605A4